LDTLRLSAETKGVLSMTSFESTNEVKRDRDVGDDAARSSTSSGVVARELAAS
jgi:hypothetical protein